MGESSTCARCEGGILIQVVHWLITANPGNKFREFYVCHFNCIISANLRVFKAVKLKIKTKRKDPYFLNTDSVDTNTSLA